MAAGPAGGLLAPPWARSGESLEHKATFIYDGVGASLCLDSCCYHSIPSWNACPHLLGTEDSEQIKQLVKISWQPARSSEDQGNLGWVRCPRWSWTEQCLRRKQESCGPGEASLLVVVPPLQSRPALALGEAKGPARIISSSTGAGAGGRNCLTQDRLSRTTRSQSAENLASRTWEPT